MAFVSWGDHGASGTVICVHGLTRNGRDFDALAAALSKSRRVVCPDVVGRGKSDWLRDPQQYQTPQYAADMAALIARLNVGRVDWVGTSMGGLIGMALAALPGSPIRRLVLNDVGPFVPKAALKRIGDYCGKAPNFADQNALERYLREVHGSFGPLTDVQWNHLATHGGMETENGLALAHDPSIAVAFQDAQPIVDVDLWPLWDAIRCPVLVLRGESSDVLLAETAAEMAQRGPRATVVEFRGCGHAPALMEPEQIAVVDDWLAS